MTGAGCTAVDGRAGVVATGAGSTGDFSGFVEVLRVGSDLCSLTGLGVWDLSLSSLSRDRIVGSVVGSVGLRFRPVMACAVEIAAAAGCAGVFRESTSGSLTTMLPTLLETLAADDVETEEEAQSRSLFPMNPGSHQHPSTLIQPQDSELTALSFLFPSLFPHGITFP